jgi:hypothetical protein
LELEEDRILWDDHGFMAEYLYYWKIIENQI